MLLSAGNFFTNIGSILVFAIFGTVISALVVGGGVYLLGLADVRDDSLIITPLEWKSSSHQFPSLQVVYRLNFVESFAFGSLISAVDPVATLAIFQALDVEPVLNMLVLLLLLLFLAVSVGAAAFPLFRCLASPS